MECHVALGGKSNRTCRGVFGDHPQWSSHGSLGTIQFRDSRVFAIANGNCRRRFD